MLAKTCLRLGRNDEAKAWLEKLINSPAKTESDRNVREIYSFDLIVLKFCCIFIPVSIGGETKVISSTDEGYIFNGYKSTD